MLSIRSQLYKASQLSERDGILWRLIDNVKGLIKKRKEVK